MQAQVFGTITIFLTKKYCNSFYSYRSFNNLFVYAKN